MSGSNTSSAVLGTERLLSATPHETFAAFEQPDLLSRWWGPNGFTNTFETFEFKPGGRWTLVMHGPDGTHYDNENVFRVIEPGSRIVIEHVVNPWFQLTVTLADRGHQTHLTWAQEFESPEVADRLRTFINNANEEVLDRLESVLASQRP